MKAAGIPDPNPSESEDCMQRRGSRLYIELILMLVVSGILYLPFIAQFGYYNDDWYSMYAARVAGTNAFHEMYAIDRPGRAYVMIPLYQLFQGNPLYYSISAYVLRFLGTVALLWLLRLLWPARKRETFLVALLFLVYPGFLSMPNAIDFQSHLVGILLAFVSLGLSVYGYSRPMDWKWVLCWLGAVLTGWAYLSQMEYYIGFEAVRLLLFGLLVYRERPGWKAGLGKLLRKWLPYSIIPLGYLFWRIFLFNNERATTDVGTAAGDADRSPPDDPLPMGHQLRTKYFERNAAGLERAAVPDGIYPGYEKCPAGDPDLAGSRDGCPAGVPAVEIQGRSPWGRQMTRTGSRRCSWWVWPGWFWD